MIELFDRAGILTMGSRLRWLADCVTRDADEIYRLYDIDIRPKWFPVLYMLFNSDDNSVTGIARAIGQSHPSVSTIIREMKAAGLVIDTKNADDRQASYICLTERGRALEPRLRHACDDVVKAVAEIESSDNSLWKALDNWEKQLSDKSLLARVKALKGRHDRKYVEIVDYRPEHLLTFKRLNVMWINSHWSLEPHDLEVLGNPEKSILSKGGQILVALVNGQPAGVVALCPMPGDSGYDFEIAKLAVDPEARGNGIGDALFSTAIERARSLGAKKLFLESNTLLKPAIGLYRKFGFTELSDYHPAYARGDIQMELNL